MASVKGQQRSEARRHEKKYCRLSQTVTVAEMDKITSWLLILAIMALTCEDLRHRA